MPLSFFFKCAECDKCNCGLFMLTLRTRLFPDQVTLMVFELHACPCLYLFDDFYVFVWFHVLELAGINTAGTCVGARVLICCQCLHPRKCRAAEDLVICHSRARDFQLDLRFSQGQNKRRRSPSR